MCRHLRPLPHSGCMQMRPFTAAQRQQVVPLDVTSPRLPLCKFSHLKKIISLCRVRKQHCVWVIRLAPQRERHAAKPRPTAGPPAAEPFFELVSTTRRQHLNHCHPGSARESHFHARSSQL